MIKIDWRRPLLPVPMPRRRRRARIFVRPLNPSDNTVRGSSSLVHPLRHPDDNTRTVDLEWGEVTRRRDGKERVSWQVIGDRSKNDPSAKKREIGSARRFSRGGNRASHARLFLDEAWSEYHNWDFLMIVVNIFKPWCLFLNFPLL